MTIRDLLASTGNGGRIVFQQTFSESGNLVLPPDIQPTDRVIVDLWGAGGSGGIAYSPTDLVCGMPGAGGGHNRQEYLARELNATEPVIVGSGAAPASITDVASGANGSTGGYSEFKGRRAYGGGGGAAIPAASGGHGGSGGGTLSPGLSASQYRGGEPQVAAPAGQDQSTGGGNIRWAPGEWGGGPSSRSFTPNSSYQFAPIHGGAGGIAGTDRTLRSSVWGGAAGGAYGNVGGAGTELGGLSAHGGNGADSPIPVTATANYNGNTGSPRGGGGSGAKRGNGTGTVTSGAGGRGEVVVTIIRGI